MQIEKYPLPVVCIIAVRNDKRGAPEIQIQSRTKKRKDDPYYGIWELPQGKMRHGESVRDSVRRELLEETGLEIEALESIHNDQILQVKKSSINTFDPIGLTVDLRFNHIGFGVAIRVKGTPKETSHASKHQWMGQKEIENLIESDDLFPLNVGIIQRFFQLNTLQPF